MEPAEIAELVGYLFLSYAVGWASGYSIYIFKRITDLI